MISRTLKITISALLIMLFGLGGQRQAAATNCTSSISAPCVITASGSFTVTADFSVTSSSNSGSVCNPNGTTGVGICINSSVNDVAINLSRAHHFRRLGQL